MRLGQTDLEAIVGFLAEADALGFDQPYAPSVLERLRRLVPCDELGHQEADLAARRFVGDRGDESEEDDALYWMVGPCPIMEYRARTRDMTAVRMSDLISHGRYHGLPVYREYFQPVGLDHVLDLGLSTAPTSYRSLVLLRGHDVPDFTERDRAVLEMLRPHLRAREARAALVALVDSRRSLPEDGVSPDEAQLTTREREILAMVAEGKTNAQIATELWISPTTVKKHLENIYLKLGVGSRAAAASRISAQY